MRFALLTVRLKNGMETVAVKNGSAKKTENVTDIVRYGHGSIRYGHDDKFGPLTV